MDLKDVKKLLAHYISQLKYLNENKDPILEEDRKQLETLFELRIKEFRAKMDNILLNNEKNVYCKTGSDKP
ncbi:MAG: hypothetical protein HRT69_09860 [Flavobacteriaceae bacterium]|nr:hypothetical protein [Flavobacteriaceae bacterium]